MSAEEAAGLLASLADNEPEAASGEPTRRSGRSGRARRVSVDDNNKEMPEQPCKHAKKPASAPKSDSDLKKTIRHLKKQFAEAKTRTA